VTDWTAGLGLLLANKGTTSTCVAWRGSPAVDVTWATSELYPRIREWRVTEGVETLSDHFYRFMEVVPEDADKNNNRHARGGARLSGPSPPPRWRPKEKDREMLRVAAIVSAWSWVARETTRLGSVDEEAETLQGYMIMESRRLLVDVGDRGVAGELRADSQKIPEGRRRMRDEEEISRCYGVYREARRTLQREIKIAKARSWKELMEAVESDPWGRPY
jgi:hypothetical protein